MTSLAGKHISTLRARAALLGVELYQLADGGFLVRRWGLMKALPDLEAVDRFLARLEG